MLRSFAQAGGLSLAVLDLGIGTARKIAGFCALLALGWLYFRELVLGESLHSIFPTAPDPDLRETLWVALMLILAQGWDIPTAHIASNFGNVADRLPHRPDHLASSAMAAGAASAVRLVVQPPKRFVEPIVVWLGRFMDLCVAIANKLGALAVLVAMAVLAWQLLLGGRTIRAIYPDAVDPQVDLLADLCVYVVVLAWWAMPFEQIVVFWKRLRATRAP